MGDIANQIYAARYEYEKESGHPPECLLLSEDVYKQLKAECQNFLVSPTVSKEPETIFGIRIKVVETHKEGEC